MKIRRETMFAALLLGGLLVTLGVASPVAAREMSQQAFAKEEGLPEEFPDMQTSGNDASDVAAMGVIGDAARTSLGAQDPCGKTAKTRGAGVRGARRSLGGHRD